MHDAITARLTVQGPLYGFNLSPDAPDARQRLRFPWTVCVIARYSLSLLSYQVSTN